MKNYIKQSNPTTIPTEDNKLIEEHFGRVSTGLENYSIAHMVAPPGWSEPPQQPEFDEITIVISGKKQVIVDGEHIVLHSGESILVKAGATVQYSNPFDEPVNYWSVCVPAFSPETVHRSE